MKKTLIALLAGVVVTGAFAQGKPVSTAENNKQTLTLTLSGKADIYWAYRDTVLNEAALGTLGGVNFGAGVSGAQSDSFFTGVFAFNVDAKLDGGPDAHVEIASKYLDSGPYSTVNSLAAGGDNKRFGDNAIALFVERAYLTFNDFLTANLALRFGIQDVKWDVRGKGNAIFLDQVDSQYPLTQAASELAGTANPLRVTSEPVGFLFCYKRDQLDVDLAIIPEVTPAGFGQGSKNSITYLSGMYNIETGDMAKKAGVILCAFDGGANPSAAVGSVGGNSKQLITFGVGASLKFTKQLEVFAELYTQSGKALSVQDTATTTKDVKTEGKAFDLGVNYMINDNLWVELSYLLLTGNKTPTTGVDAKYEGFISAENNDEFKIVESNDWGFNLWNNYTRIAFKVGYGTAVGSSKVQGNNLLLDFKLGNFKLEETIPTVFLPAGSSAMDDSLGNEIDLGMTYKVSDQAAFTVDFDYLFGADALETFTHNKEDKTWMFLLGTKVNW